MAGYGNNAIFLQTLQGLGVPLQSAIGAMGSLGWESGERLNNQALNANDAGAGNHSYGWGQWNRQRAANLFAEAARQGKHWSDPSVQAAHIRNELTGPYSGVLAALKRANSVGEGADIWTRNYEVPKIVNSGDRANRGLSIARAMGLPVEGTASYPSTLTAMASTAGGGGGGGGVDPGSTAGMLASVADPGWTPPPVEPVPGADYAGLSGLGGGGSVGSGEAAGGASGGLTPDSMEDPYGDKELQSRLAGLEQLPQAAVPIDQIGARYKQAKLAGGPVGDQAQAGLADLFKLKGVGQNKALRKSSRVA